MKEVLAILRPGAWSVTREVVTQSGFTAFTERRVLGRGATRGLARAPKRAAGSRVLVEYLPKRMISWIVDDQAVRQLVDLLLLVNRTGHLGDGKIFVLPVEEAVRLRTGQRGAPFFQPSFSIGVDWEGAAA